MRIAQIAPLHESVPPALYGGTERVVWNLSESLLELGHDVTLFASGDSRTRARLSPATPHALRLGACQDTLAHHICLVEDVCRRADDFDILHFHLDYLHFPLTSRLAVPRVTTQHGRMDLPDLPPVFRTFPDEPQVSISRSQRKPLPYANWVGTIHHGLPLDQLRFHPEPGRYLAFLGRVSPEKGLDRAIEIATRVGMALKIAAKIDDKDREFFEHRLRPLMKHPLIEFIGEIGEHEKEEFLGKAAGLLFPIDWPEPFGLVMIEAMACGTPVVAFRRGSVPEIMRDGVTGFVVDNVEAAVKATQAITSVERLGCRRHFEQNFSADRMARDYVALYEKVIAQPTRGPRGALSAL